LQDCYRAAIGILKYRFNSTAELQRKLRAKGFDRETIAETIARLTEEKWLNDERFAAAYVRSRLSKSKGRVRIRRELIRAGVDDETAARAVGENVDGEDERLRAVAAAEKRLPILIRRYGHQAARNKLIAYLLKQGYEASLVYDVIAESFKRVASSEQRAGQ
jgi:SOS response regulatory protein OraA/RecX